MTLDTVALVVFACILGGWTARKFWQANADVKSAKARLAASRTVAWRARRIGAVVGFGLLALAWHWVVTVNHG